ncbi:MAG: FAD binding domain-containing protein [Acidimicrobiaceae bacterium]|nr:FAD binding domain-containing protein [Acidimicrobiaceae bacterium]
MPVLPELGLVRSEELDEVLAAVDYDHAPYAGGTELVPAMGLGLRRPVAIVDLKRVEALRGIEVDAAGRTATIGAAVTHRRLSDHPGVREHLPTLAAAASRVGNARVRSTGTVGGNLCFAEPRSDLGCVLVALGATVEARSSRGARNLPIDELIVGAFETSLEPDEILAAVMVPFEPPGMSYWKLQSYERPTLGVALVVSGSQWQVTVGAATERPTRTTLAPGDTAGLAAFVNGLDLSDDMTGPPAYKRAVLRAHLQQALGAEL